MFEDDYDGIADNWSYYWVHGEGQNDHCTPSCNVDGYSPSGCDTHSSWWILGP